MSVVFVWGREGAAPPSDLSLFEEVLQETNGELCIVLFA